MTKNLLNIILLITIFNYAMWSIGFNVNILHSAVSAGMPRLGYNSTTGKGFYYTPRQYSEAFDEQDTWRPIYKQDKE